MILRNAFSFLIVICAFAAASAQVEEVIEESVTPELQAEAVHQELSQSSQVGLEEVLLYHQSVIQVGKDVEQWISTSRTGVAKTVSQNADVKACYKGRGESYCEKAIQALYPYSVIPLKDDKIFELGRRLREAGLEFQVGVRVFKLTTALRFFVKEEVYNGVPAPKVATASSVKRFVSEIQGFHDAKVIDLRKGRANIPPLPPSARR